MFDVKDFVEETRKAHDEIERIFYEQLDPYKELSISQCPYKVGETYPILKGYPGAGKGITFTVVDIDSKLDGNYVKWVVHGSVDIHPWTIPIAIVEEEGGEYDTEKNNS